MFVRYYLISMWWYSFLKKVSQDLKPVYFAVYPNRKNTKHSKVRYKYSVAASIILSRNQVVSQILVTLLQMSSFLNFEQDKKIYHCVTGIVSAIEILSCLLALTISRVGEFPWKKSSGNTDFAHVFLKAMIKLRHSNIFWKDFTILQDVF